MSVKNQSKYSPSFHTDRPPKPLCTGMPCPGFVNLSPRFSAISCSRKCFLILQTPCLLFVSGATREPLWIHRFCNCSDLQIYECLGFLWLKCTFYFTKNCTSKVAYYKWVRTLNDEVLATAIIDRLLYRCEVIKLVSTSYRLENRKTIFSSDPAANGKQLCDAASGTIHTQE
ncbi:MAG: ATP-binding protein [Candidatus Cryptobacteroides sp.]|jgi:hypothetical protein